MIERLIEKRIVDKLKSAVDARGIEGLCVYGLWNDSADVMKSKEQSSSKAFCIVKIPPRSYTTFGICEVQMNISIALVVRADACQDDEVSSFTEPIVDILNSWNMVHEYEELVDFEVEGFYPGGINITQGEGPDIDRSSMTWSVSFNVLLVGSIVHQ